MKLFLFIRHWWLFLLTILVAGCTIITKHNLDSEFGTPESRQRIVQDIGSSVDFYHQVKPIVDRRCVVCHGCYDAPCQLKLSSIEGIDRGASKELVYNGARISAAEPTRIFEDAQSTKEWRDKSFFPILNERRQTPAANLEASVIYQMLALKRKHPLPEAKVLSDNFDFSLDRKQQCPSIEEFPSFKRKFSESGMPYGLPGLNKDEFNTLEKWISGGARVPPLNPLSSDTLQRVQKWERFFNGQSLKQQLMSRYIYEHLYIGNLYFSDSVKDGFFKLVRSATPPGQPIIIISTRRVYDDPKVENFYYRLQRVHSSILVKTHMPYALNPGRMTRWHELFLTPDYQLDELPSYAVEVASNPFLAFKDLPVKSRYRFMIDEAQFTIMGFIKGPVCRGQVALSVIDNHFWVVFINPDSDRIFEERSKQFLAEQSKHLRLPAEAQSNASPLKAWRKYSELQQEYHKAKMVEMAKVLPDDQSVTLDLIWDGDDNNENAALTVFRHFDSASVVKGFVGKPPKTAWVIGYTLLERIHYLLVSGFDVYGNLGHQLVTRLYMDFLRMDGEFNFLTLLPKDDRAKERKFWYRNAPKSVRGFVEGRRGDFDRESAIQYSSSNPKLELYQKLRRRIRSATNHKYSLDNISHNQTIYRQLKRLSSSRGEHLSHLPLVALLRITAGSKESVFTLIHNEGMTNVSSIFGEAKRRVPKEDYVTVASGIIGAYPSAFFSINEDQLAEFVDDIGQLKTKIDYERLLDKFGIRRTNQNFWTYSDWVHAKYKKLDPIRAGLLDYNRFENR